MHRWLNPVGVQLQHIESPIAPIIGYAANPIAALHPRAQHLQFDASRVVEQGVVYVQVPQEDLIL